jgi:hypothetical protein
MNRSEFAAISKGQGAKIRSFLAAAANPQASTSRSAILADLDDAGITDEDQRTALLATYTDLAKKARGGKANPFELRGAADLLAVEHVRAIRAADDLMGEDGIPETADTRDDDEKMARRVQAKSRGLTDEMFDQEEADAAERERLQRLGVQTTS